MIRRRLLSVLRLEEEEMKEWKILYDSGKIEDEKIAFDTVDISGCEELYGILLCMKNESATGSRDVQLVIRSQESSRNFIIGKSLIATNANKSCEFHMEKIADALSVDAFYNQNAVNTDFDAGYHSDNNSSVIAGYALNMSELKSAKIQSFNNVAGYEFGAGSRCRIYGR